ncbi:hypothetical protein BDA99DRAFT_539525 [Phascolomyces articulosus]|uniref:Ras-GAP domain-containing protein n=1 Tax=Phascolomyces articulosus TaxID=60185 RepID=A0AAD5JVI1_9FUNG|nr:hypothetical protein BDA99DRAFT_539525 [Phascolomyces articulosus]
MIAEKTLIMSMVDRLEAELPCNKTNTSMKFEQVKYIDPFMLRTGIGSILTPAILPCKKEHSLGEIVETLVRLSIYRLSTVTEAVVGALERIPISKNHPALAFNDETTPTGMLNSQYFLLCLLSACLQQWREKNPSDLMDHPELSTQCRRTNGHCLTNPSIVQRPSAALDDKVAHRILAIISPFLRQPPRTATAINREIDHRLLLLGLRMNEGESIFTETYNCMRISEHYTADTLLLTRLYVIAGRVAFFISIDNWCVTYNRIKSRLEALAYNPSTAEEIPQIGEVQLMECAALNKERLGKLLDALYHTFKTMKQPMQHYVSFIAYRAIWGWIEAFDQEFIQLYKEKGRIFESLDILFTLCQSNPVKKGKELLWPFQTALLLISPGILEEAVEFDENKQINSSPHPSILEFVRNIKKMAIEGDKRDEEIASMCVLDICRAASYLDKEKGLSVIHRLVVTAKNDLQDRLFNIHRPLVVDKVFISSNEQPNVSVGQEQRGGTLIDNHCLLMTALATLYRLNPRNAIFGVFPMCLDDESPILYKSALARALRSLITFFKNGVHEDPTSPWQLGSDPFYDALCGPLRQIFIKYVNNVAGYNDCSTMKNHSRNWSSNTMTSTDKTKYDAKSITSQTAGLDINEKFHAIWEILSLYVADPKLVIMGRKTLAVEERVHILEALIQCLRLSSNSIVFLATECVRKLHTSTYIPYWGYPKHSMAFFWKMSSTMIMYFSKELLVLRSIQTTETLSCMRTIHQILIERVKYLKSVNKKTVLEGWEATDYLQGAITLHVAGLIWLNASDDDVLLANLVIIREFCKEIEYLFVNNQYTDAIGFQALRALLENYPVYRELSKLNREQTQGRKRAQKQIWRLLRMLPHDSPASLVAWREIWKRWKVLTEVLIGIPVQNLASSSEPPRSPSSSRSFGSGSSSISPSSSATGVSSGGGGTGGGHLQTGASFEAQDHNNERGVNKKRLFRATWNYNEQYILWNNCTGFLASLAGVCLGRKSKNGLGDEDDTVDDYDDNDDYNAMLASEDTEQQATDFIRVLVQLLSCNDVFIREKITDILSKELSPAVQTLLLEQLEHALSTYGVPASMKFNCFMLVEQTSIILSSYLENLANEPTTSAAVSSQIFTNLVDQCATYLLCKPADANKSTLGTDIIRIRLRFAHLCESLMTSKNTTSWIMIQKEFVLRTKLLGTIIEWTSGFQLTQPPHQQVEQTESPAIERNKNAPLTGSTPATAAPDNTVHSPSTTPTPAPMTLKDSNIHRDLEVTCIRAMTLLLDGLPLQPNTFGSFMGTEENYIHVKCHMFNRYFTYFNQVLQECVALLNDPVKAFSKQQATPSVGDLSNTRQTTFTNTASPHSGYSMNSAHSPRSSSEEGSIQRAFDIRSCAIEAISNLVHANLDVGLSQTLNMSYDNNMSIRCAYTQIITSVLEKGAQFENLSATINIDRYRRLVDILTDESNNFGFAQFLCQCCQASKADITARCLLKCFASKKKTVKFLITMIEREICSTDDEAEILRRTTITTRLLSYLAEIIGTTYIQQTLHPVFNKLSKKVLPEGTSYEVNPLRVDDENICQNIENVSEAADMILTSICNSSDKAPRAILQLCHCISICAESRFPEAKYKAVGAFIFLRFFCPAIVSPESTSFRGKISPTLYRGLLLAGKIAQNLANNVLFGDKEAYMIPLNDFLTRNIYRVTRFLREISKDPRNNNYVEDLEGEFESISMSSSDYSLLHHVLIDNIQAMAQQLYKKNVPYAYQDGGKTVDRAILSEMILRGQYECVSNLLAHLGSPPDDMARKKASDFCLRGRPLNFANQSYIDFMRRNSERYIDDILAKKIVYEAGRSRAGRPVLYFIFRRIQIHETDFESLMYMALRTMEVLSAEPFEVLIDFTMYCTELNSSPDQKWFYRLVRLTPREIYDNIAAVHALNANFDLCRFLKRDMPKSVKEFVSKFQFFSSETDIHRYIHPKELHLPESDAELMIEPLVTVTGHRQLTQNSDRMIPVTIKLTHRYIQSITMKRQKLFSGCSAILNDVFAIADIEDVTLGLANSESTHEIRFKNQKTQGTVIFHASSSHDAAQFVFVLKNLMSRVEAQPVSPINRKLIPPISSIRPENVPGILLNMALINMGNQNEELRHTSYTMLSALSESFHFVLASQFMESKGVCIPKNDTFWITGVSTKLAFTQPELTLELFREWFSGYNISDESNKRLCVEYIVPWLSNIGKIYSVSTGDDQVVTKTKEILHMLIDVTVKANETIRHILLCKIWKTIGNNSLDGSMFIDLVLNTVTEYANEHGGVGSIQTEIMTDIVVSMFNMVVCTKILAKLHHIFLRTAFNWTQSLVNHPAWRKSITILIRFVLMGSFYYRGPVRNCTPEVLHVISITAGIGTTLERETLHSMMVNFKQALCIIEPVGSKKVTLMLEKLGKVASVRTRLLFGLTKQYTTPYTATPEATTDIVESVDLYTVETIIEHLIDGVETVAPNTDTLNAWKSRWLGLASSLAFQFNPAIQPRAFIVIGCLAREGVDDELLYQMLNSLKNALANAHFELVQGIIMCLRRIVCSVPPDSCYILPLFWISLLLVQVDHRPLFSATLELLSGVFHALQECGMIGGGEKNPANLLLGIRQGNSLMQEYDQELGVSFEKYFSFGVATVLLKSAIHDLEMLNALKPTLMDFLTVEVNQYDDINGKKIRKKNGNEDGGTGIVPVSALGYMAALLPCIASDENVQRELGFKQTTDIIKKLCIPDKTSELLFITLLTIQLSSHDNQRKLRVYEFLAEAATLMPDTFSMVYETIVSKMNKILSNSTDLEFTERVNSILLTICSSSSFDTGDRSKRKLKSALEHAGFSALIDLHSPRKRDVIANATLASRLVKHIIDTSS